MRPRYANLGHPSWVMQISDTQSSGWTGIPARMATLDPTRYEVLLERLRQARLEAGLTQVQVSLDLGMHQSFVSRLECGERRVDFVEVEILAEMYGKDITYFLTAKKQGRRK